MKRTCVLILAGYLLALPAVVRAQFTFATNSDSITITGYTGPGGAVTIPETINVLPVTGIGNDAFHFCSVTSVTIPNSVDRVGDSAFDTCNHLTNVTIGDGVTEIGWSAFYYCTNLSSVAIPASVTSIGGYAFGGCRRLASVTIPSGVTNIGSWAFFSCTNLAIVCFQGDAPHLGSFAFNSDAKVTVYYLPGTAGWGATFGGRLAVLWNPQAENPSVQANHFGFTITGTDGLIVVVEACADLARSEWSAVQTNTLTDGLAYFSDPQSAELPARFYRLKLP